MRRERIDSCRERGEKERSEIRRAHTVIQLYEGCLEEHSTINESIEKENAEKRGRKGKMSGN